MDGFGADGAWETHADGGVWSWMEQGGPVVVLLPVDPGRTPAHGRLEERIFPSPSSTPRRTLQRHLSKNTDRVLSTSFALN